MILEEGGLGVVVRICKGSMVPERLRSTDLDLFLAQRNLAVKPYTRYFANGTSCAA
jgi:hypothetical protein